MRITESHKSICARRAASSSDSLGSMEMSVQKNGDAEVGETAGVAGVAGAYRRGAVFSRLYFLIQLSWKLAQVRSLVFHHQAGSRSGPGVAVHRARFSRIGGAAGDLQAARGQLRAHLAFLLLKI